MKTIKERIRIHLYYICYIVHFVEDLLSRLVEGFFFFLDFMNMRCLNLRSSSS